MLTVIKRPLSKRAGSSSFSSPHLKQAFSIQKTTTPSYEEYKDEMYLPARTGLITPRSFGFFFSDHLVMQEQARVRQKFRVRRVITENQTISNDYKILDGEFANLRGRMLSNRSIGVYLV